MLSLSPPNPSVAAAAAAVNQLWDCVKHRGFFIFARKQRGDSKFSPGVWRTGSVSGDVLSNADHTLEDCDSVLKQDF